MHYFLFFNDPIFFRNHMLIMTYQHFFVDVKIYKLEIIRVERVFFFEKKSKSH